MDAPFLDVCEILSAAVLPAPDYRERAVRPAEEAHANVRMCEYRHSGDEDTAQRLQGSRAEPGHTAVVALHVATLA